MWKDMCLDNNIKEVLKDRLEAWELVEALNLTTEDVIEAFEETITEKLKDVLEYFDLDDLLQKDEND